MNPHEVLAGAVRAALAGYAPLVAGVNGVFDANPGRATRPYVLIDDPVLIDWSTKDQAGREGRLSVLVRDSGERRQRVRALAGQVEAAVAAMPAAIGDGWRIASLVLQRSRVVAEGEGRVTALVEFRVRMLREG